MYLYFCYFFFDWYSYRNYEFCNAFSEMHLRQSQFTYSACEPFTKSKERIPKFKELVD